MGKGRALFDGFFPVIQWSCRSKPWWARQWGWNVRGGVDRWAVVVVVAWIAPRSGWGGRWWRLTVGGGCPPRLWQ